MTTWDIPLLPAWGLMHAIHRSTVYSISPFTLHFLCNIIKVLKTRHEGGLGKSLQTTWLQHPGLRVVLLEIRLARGTISCNLKTLCGLPLSPEYNNGILRVPQGLQLLRLQDV